uniref:ERC protein 2-like n=1 Tax=Ciona intestinalis TaxID=7719 RepID=UPI000EF487E0|nr:ERC protein 2-like [Ciona intestinalis]|eukprot:XP_002122341.4 ERC protein 2-like [Ciona intestinalis]
MFQGLTKLLQKKEDEIENLNDEVKDQQVKAEELADAIRQLEIQKPMSSTKDNLLDQLRQQLKQADAALQDALDEKLKTQDDHDKKIREQLQQHREQERQMEHLKTSLQISEETVVSMDQMINEKDKSLQDLTNKHKALLKELQQKEEQRISALRERDELLIHCDEEKLRFTEMSRKMLRRSSSDLSSNISQMEAERRISDLQHQLRKKEEEYKEAQSSYDRVASDLRSSISDLQRALRSKEEDSERHRRTIAQQDLRDAQDEGGH